MDNSLKYMQVGFVVIKIDTCSMKQDRRLKTPLTTESTTGAETPNFSSKTGKTSYPSTYTVKSMAHPKLGLNILRS